MNGILSNQRYVNLSKVDDVQLDGVSVVENRIVNLNNIIQIILSSINTGLAENNYTKEEVNNLIANRSGFAIVQSLPTNNISPNKIYLVQLSSDNDNTDTDAYDEYIYVNGKWEHVGSFQANFSNYYTKTEVEQALTNALANTQNEITNLQNNFNLLQNHVGNIDAVLDAINGEVV